jgi:hypothetical protein
MLVATNGHILAAYHSQGAESDQKRILHAPSAFDDIVKQVALHEEGVVTVTGPGGPPRLAISGHGQARLLKPGLPFVEGHPYPDWRAVVPDAHDLVR